MNKGEKGIDDIVKFNEKVETFLSELAKTTEEPPIKSIDSIAKLTKKLYDLTDEKLFKNNTYAKNVYNFSEQLNGLTDDFIKENK